MESKAEEIKVTSEVLKGTFKQYQCPSCHCISIARVSRKIVKNEFKEDKGNILSLKIKCPVCYVTHSLDVVLAIRKKAEK